MRRSNVANAVPGGADLNEGELAINTMDGALYFKKSNGTIITGHDDTIMHIDSTNSRVGIGTASPNSPLHLQSSIDYVARFQSTDTTVGILLQDSNATNRITNTNGHLVLSADINGVVANSSIRFIVDSTSNDGADADMVLNSTGLGIGTNSPSTALEVAGSIRIDNGASFTSYEVYRDNILYGNVGGGSNQFTIKAANNKNINLFDDSGVGLTVKNGGNIGIGTDSPSQKLTVVGDASISTTGNSTGLRIITSATGEGYLIFGDTADNSMGGMAYSNSTNALMFDSNNAERMRIDSSGNVGIGTTSPSYKLHVRSADASDDVAYIHHDNASQSSGTLLKVRTDAGDSNGYTLLDVQTNSGSALFVRGDRKVGIGTSSPSSILDVAGSAAVLTITDTRNQTFTVGDTMCSLAFDSDDTSGGAGTASHPRALISLVAETTFGSSTGLSFSTKQDTTTAPTEKMRISTGGNVGIGTTHPDSKLDVTGGDITVNTTGTGFMNFKYSNSSKGTIGTDGIDLKITAVADLQLLPTGNVGIGTSSPGRKLTVQGASGDNLPVRIIGGSGTSHGSMEFQDPNTTADYKVVVGSKGDDFYIQAGGGEKVRVKSDGNVGIGTVSPARKLEVDFTGSTVGAKFTRSDTTGSSTIEFANSAGVKSTIGFNAGTNAFDIKHNSAVRLAVSNTGAITFNNAFTFPTTIGSAGEVLKVPTSGTSLIWGNASGGGGGSSIEDNDGDTKIQVEESADEDIIRFDIAGTQKMFLSSTQLDVTGDLAISGNLNIAGDINSTSVTNLDVTDKTITMANNSGSSVNADGAGIIIEGPSSNASLLWNHGNQQLRFNKDVFTPAGFVIGTTATNVGKMYNSSGVMALEAYSTRSISFGNVTNGEHVRINADGNVGIGTTSPNGKFTISDGSSRQFEFYPENSTDTNLILNYDRVTSTYQNLQTRAATHQFLIGDSEKARIDSSGNLLVGTTSAANSSAGFRAYSGGNGAFTIAGTALSLNRLSSDGEILNFQKDTTTVGSIRSFAGDLIIQTGITGLRFNDGADAIHPVIANGTVSDGATDLGLSNARFKDLHLSGTGYFGTSVGIGTTSPEKALHVAGLVDNGGIRLTSANDTNTNYIFFGDTTSASVGRIAYDHTNNRMEFFTNGSQVANIDSSGKVGIGTSSPTSPLTVKSNSTSSQDAGFTLQANGSTNAIFKVGEKSGGKARLHMFDGTTEKIALHTDGTASHISAGNVGIGTSSPDTKLDVTSSGVNGILLNQDTVSAATSSRLMFKDNVRTNLLINVNGILQFRTDAAVNSSSGTTRLSVSPTLVKSEVPLRVEEYQIDTTVTSTSATTQVAINTFAAATFRSARFTVQITNTTDSTYHSTEILAIHDGTTANITEFGEVHTGSSVEATFDADVSSGNFRLLATPSSTNSMTFKVVCHSLTV